jgi:hypothetical protein
MVATADRTQADLLAYRNNQGVEYESFYIVNKKLVKAGTHDLVMAIADRSDVSAINANHGYQLEKPINPKMSTSQPQNIEPNISFVKADQVGALGYTSQGTVIAGNDTG